MSNDNRSGNGGCGVGCLIALIIMLVVVITLVVLAWYILLIVIGIILIVSAIIGFFYGIKNNIKALSDSINTNRRYVRPRASKPIQTLCKVLKVCKDQMVFAWKANGASIRDMFVKSQPHKFFSFNKWMYLFSCLSIAIWGVVLTIGILYLYFALAIAAAVLLITAVVIICAIPIVIAIPLSLIRFFQNFAFSFGTVRRTDRPGGGDAAYIFSKGYPHILKIFVATFQKNLTDAKDKMREGDRFRLLSFKRWIPQCAGVFLVGLGVILQVVLLVLHALVVTVIMVGYALFMGVILGIDALMSLFVNKPAHCSNNRCSTTTKRHVYACDCGNQFKRMHPSPFGIFKRSCRCGRILPCTVFTGKHRLRDICPKCGYKIFR